MCRGCGKLFADPRPLRLPGMEDPEPGWRDDWFEFGDWHVGFTVQVTKVERRRHGRYPPRRVA